METPALWARPAALCLAQAGVVARIEAAQQGKGNFGEKQADMEHGNEEKSKGRGER